MKAFGQKMRRDVPDRFYGISGLSRRETSSNYRDALAMHFRSAFQILRLLACHEAVGTYHQAKRGLLRFWQRLSGHKSCEHPLVIETSNVEVTGASRPLCEAPVLTDGLEVVADEDWKRKYFELVMAVGNKHPGETRHQTALRYIRQSEAPSTRAAQTEAANVKLSGSTALSASPAPTPGYATEADK